MILTFEKLKQKQGNQEQADQFSLCYIESLKYRSNKSPELKTIYFLFKLRNGWQMTEWYLHIRTKIIQQLFGKNVNTLLDKLGLTSASWSRIAISIFEKIQPTRLIHSIINLVKEFQFRTTEKLNAVHFINACMLEIIYHKKLEINDLDLTYLIEFKSNMITKSAQNDSQIQDWFSMEKLKNEKSLYKTRTPDLRKRKKSSLSNSSKRFRKKSSKKNSSKKRKLNNYQTPLKRKQLNQKDQLKRYNSKNLKCFNISGQKYLDVDKVNKNDVIKNLTADKILTVETTCKKKHNKTEKLFIDEYHDCFIKYLYPEKGEAERISALKKQQLEEEFVYLDTELTTTSGDFQNQDSKQKSNNLQEIVPEEESFVSENEQEEQMMVKDNQDSITSMEIQELLNVASQIESLDILTKSNQNSQEQLPLTQIESKNQFLDSELVQELYIASQTQSLEVLPKIKSQELAKPQIDIQESVMIKQQQNSQNIDEKQNISFGNNEIEQIENEKKNNEEVYINEFTLNDNSQEQTKADQTKEDHFQKMKLQRKKTLPTYVFYDSEDSDEKEKSTKVIKSDRPLEQQNRLQEKMNFIKLDSPKIMESPQKQKSEELQHSQSKEDMEKELKLLRQHKRTSSEEVTQLKSHIEKVMKELEETQIQSKEQEQMLIELQNEQPSQSSQFNTQQQNEDLQKENEELRNLVDQYKQQLERSHDTLYFQQQENQQKFDELNGKYEEVETKNEKLVQYLNKLQELTFFLAKNVLENCPELLGRINPKEIEELIHAKKLE